MPNKDPREFAKELFSSAPLLLRDAADIAIEAHEGQTRADNKTPYAFHSLRVGDRVNSTARDIEVPRYSCVMAGMFHDVIEDTKITAEELCQKIMDRLGLSKGSVDPIVSMVEELTQDNSLPWKQRRQEMIDHCGEMSLGARLIKLADRLDNISDMDGMSLEFRIRYCREARTMLEKMAGTCPSLERELAAEIARQESRMPK